MKKHTYALVGCGSRAEMFYGALARDFRETSELKAFCDINRTRMALANRYLREKYDHPEVPVYGAEQFDEMIRQERPDTVIVTTIDRLHHHYIIRAMELGCDVITEKPMTVDDEKCRAIMEAVERTGRKLRGRSTTVTRRIIPK
jgi:Predicted dehydrogenases and related proteins